MKTCVLGNFGNSLKYGRLQVQIRFNTRGYEYGLHSRNMSSKIYN